jgi:hypothetical protein
MSIVYLRKANADLVSHCSCGDGRVGFPAQADCPWCGCGWLFTCISCRKAFTFAEGVETEATWENLAREDFRKKYRDEPSEEDVADWVEVMKEVLADVEVGRRYVILDGTVFAAEATNVEFDGWYAHHTLAALPQVQGLTDDSAVGEVLRNPDYWYTNALPDPD